MVSPIFFIVLGVMVVVLVLVLFLKQRQKSKPGGSHTKPLDPVHNDPMTDGDSKLPVDPTPHVDPVVPDPVITPPKNVIVAHPEAVGMPWEGCDERFYKDSKSWTGGPKLWFGMQKHDCLNYHDSDGAYSCKYLTAHCPK